LRKHEKGRLKPREAANDGSDSQPRLRLVTTQLSLVQFLLSVLSGPANPASPSLQLSLRLARSSQNSDVADRPIQPFVGAFPLYISTRSLPFSPAANLAIPLTVSCIHYLCVQIPVTTRVLGGLCHHKPAPTSRAPTNGPLLAFSVRLPAIGLSNRTVRQYSCDSCTIPTKPRSSP
jgi:hypothetical protein